MNAAEVPKRDQLDDKANRFFAGKVVRKDLVRTVKVGANVPAFVLEYLLGKYCASSDEVAIQMGLQVVNDTLADKYIPPDESTKAQSKVKERERQQFIDKVKVRLVDSRYWAEVVNFGHKNVQIPDRYVREYDRLLTGGIWAELEMRFEYDEEDRGKYPFWINKLTPIQLATLDLDEYQRLRTEFTTNEWLDLMVRSMGYESTVLDRREKLLFLSRLIPLCERNYNLVELGPRGTGKSYAVQEISPYAALLTGPSTVANLFGHQLGRYKGMVQIWDAIGFDEVADLQKMPKEVITMMKTYCESGQFQRGQEAMAGYASIAMFGNTQKPVEIMVQTGHLFAPMPDVIRDDMAFIDRLHFYLPGWEVPKMRNEHFTNHYGFVVDYLAEALRELRKHNYTEVIDHHFSLGDHLNARDRKAIRRTVSGLIKILHPHGDASREDLEELLRFALEGRRRVKEQLKKLGPHEYSKTAFSYAHTETGHEEWVEVPEQPEDLQAELKLAATAPSETTVSTPTASIEQLLSDGEGRRVEFKSSARWNYHRGERGKEIEHEVVKAAAGFMNAAGGTLLIGVSDDREILGLDNDLGTLGRKDLDGYENWLTTLFDTSIGKPATARLVVNFEEVDDEPICRIDVGQSDTPVYVNMKDDKWFYVRLGNSTRRLDTQETVEYIRQHWGS